MKILHVLYELKFSGAEIMYVDAADEFRSLGCELYVINSAERLGKYADMFKDAGYKVYHLPCPSGLITRWSYCQQIVRLVKKEGIDVIHTHASNMKWDMALVACLAGIRSVYTFHSCFKSRPISYIYHIWLRWSAKNLLSCKFQTISDSVYDNERLYYHNDTIKIYNWFGNKRFFPADKAEKQAVRKELGISKDSFVIISVGGCSVNKRHHDIIKALPDLLKEKNNLMYLHLIVSDVYLMTSHYEGISLTTIEALACKIPAILYDVPGLRDFNKEQLCSLLIPEQSTEIVKAIKKLRTNSGEKEMIIKNGYEMVMRKFFLPTNVRQIFKLYQGS